MKRFKPTKNKAKTIEKNPNDQALQLIDAFVSIAPLNRQQHIQAQQAIAQIHAALNSERRSDNKEKANERETPGSK